MNGNTNTENNTNTNNTNTEMDGGKRKLSAWNKHVRATRKAFKSLKGKALFKKAAATFKKTRKGGAVISPMPLNGGRKRTMKGKGNKMY